MCLWSLHLYIDKPAGLLERLLQGFAQALRDSLLHHKAVHQNLDIVLDILVQTDFLGELIQVPVDPDADIAGPSRLGNDLFVLSLPPSHNRGEHLQAALLRQRHKDVHHLVYRLAPDLTTAFRTVHDAAPRVQQTEIIIDLRHGSYRGSRVMVGRLLINGNGRRKSLDALDLRFFHLPEELPGIAGQGFHISALAFRVDRIKGQAALPRTRQPRHDDKLPPGDVQVNILQIMLRSAPDPDVFTEIPPGRRCGLWHVISSVNHGLFLTISVRIQVP